MTTAAAPPAESAAPAGTVAPEFLLVPRAHIRPSPMNPRKHFDQAKLAELAATMANGVGIIEPLVVRPSDVFSEIAVDAGKAARNEFPPYELVAGERRWRAAEIAGLDPVPVIVKDLTDAQVLEIMVIENNQREDISPLEEADGFRRLLDLGRVTLDDLAARLGRSRKYVYDRMKLRDLIPEASELLAAGRMTAGHAILLARLTPDVQARAIDPDERALFERESTLHEDEEDVDAEPPLPLGVEDQIARLGPLDEAFHGPQKARSVRELDAWIARNVRFDVEQAAAAAPLEYGETAELVSQALARPGRGKKAVSITFEYASPRETRSETERTFGSQSWRRADGRRGSSTCEHSVLGVVVAGAHYGSAFEVCVNRDKCDVHWREERKERERRAKQRAKEGAGGGSSAKASKPDPEPPWKKAQREREARGKVWKVAVPKFIDASVAAIKAVKPDALFRIIADTDRDCGLSGSGLKRAKALLPAKADADSLMRVLALACAVDDIGDGQFGDCRDEFSQTAKVLGIDIDAVLASVQTSAQPAKPAAPKKAAAAKGSKKKTTVTGAANKAVSDRMKKYWAAREAKAAGAAKKKSTTKAVSSKKAAKKKVA